VQVAPYDMPVDSHLEEHRWSVACFILGMYRILERLELSMWKNGESNPRECCSTATVEAMMLRRIG
jgi:hypothetical protein